MLVTGGSGFIGTHLCHAICREWPEAELVVLDLRPPSVECSFRQGSVTCPETVQSACRGVDCVFHLAAMISVEESISKPLECLEVNVAATLKLLEAARQEGVKRFVFSSSAAVYGDSAACPQREDAVTAPITPYGISKLESEHYLEFYRRQLGLSTVSLRYFNVYGPGQNPQSQYAAVIPRFFQRAREGSPLVVHGDGLQTRDFVHVSDVARTNLWASLRRELHGPCNVSTGQPTTILDLANEIRRLTGSSSEIEHSPRRPGDIRESWADSSKLLRLGFKAEMSLSQGLASLAGQLAEEAAQ